VKCHASDASIQAVPGVATIGLVMPRQRRSPAPIRALATALLLTACTRPVVSPRTPEPRATRPDARDTTATEAQRVVWEEMAARLCHDAGGYSMDHETLEISLSRAFFFEERGATLRPPVRAVLVAAAGALRRLGDVRIIIESDLEDGAFEGTSAPFLWSLSTARAVAVAAVLETAGIDRSRLEITARASRWQGSYDGPANLDPAKGQIQIAIATPTGQRLRLPRSSSPW
jgi:outer membrane protein OmpA-like peptidoglycan-associated protein